MNVLVRPCPFCGLAYGEHSLDALAHCVQDALGERDEDARTPLAVVESSG